MKIGNRQPLKITNFPFQKREIENTIEPLIHVIDPREIYHSFSAIDKKQINRQKHLKPHLTDRLIHYPLCFFFFQKTHNPLNLITYINHTVATSHSHISSSQFF